MSWGEDVNGDHWKGDHMDREILERMKTMVEESRYTVALCGSGMMEEVGLKGLKREDRAYEIEEKYGASPEELFNIACYSRHPERFFQFYREEILKQEMQISPAVYELAAMERAGKLQCLVTINLHDAPIKAGVKHAICLHGSVYHNRCPRCGSGMLKRKSKKGYVYYACERGAECGFMTWDVPTAQDCPSCGQTMFKKSGRGQMKPFCINEKCPDFLPEDKRGYKRRMPKATTDTVENAEEIAPAAEETEKKPAKTAKTSKTGKTAKAAKAAKTAKTTKKAAEKKPAARKKTKTESEA